MADSLGLLGQQPSAGLLGTSRWDSVWPMLMSLGAGIASGGAPGGGGWGGGIGRGLSLATNAVQQQRENQLQNALLQLKLREAGRPEIKDITLPGGGKISASVSPGGTVSPLDTSGLGPQATVPDFENTQKLRKEYQATPQYQTWAQAQPIWQSMKDASKRPTRAADLNLVYGLAKIFDPNSVVREGEMILVQDTQSIPSWLQGEINRLNGGASLQPETRSAVLQEAQSRFGAYQEALRPVFGRFSGIATRCQMPTSDFETPFEELAPMAAPTPALATPGPTPQAAGTPPNADGIIYRHADGRRIRFNMATGQWEPLN